MTNFAMWQFQMATVSAKQNTGIVLFLAYTRMCEIEASDAGFQLIGTTWDANGMQAKAYKPKFDKMLAYGCISCGSSQPSLDHGMYCCGRKRLLRT